METKGNRPNNILSIPTSLSSQTNNFFRYWVEFLKPLHHLTDREMDVTTAFLRKRYELSKDILDPIKLDKYLMNEDTKAEMEAPTEESYKPRTSTKSAVKKALEHITVASATLKGQKDYRDVRDAMNNIKAELTVRGLQ